ncbi:MAG TPA: hypothetical protein VGS27_12235 [Candidatus Sulfotelmatobacter sp.]|nr:hypothetical protein [Candidatus Sulfotelmatobacter sp.]
MYRAVCMCVFLCLASLGFSQTPSAPVQVVYVIDGSTLTTYNIDSKTLQATQVGTTALKQSVYPGITTSPDGHFVYYTAYQDYSQDGEHLYVYSTDNSGIPGSSPVQTMSVTRFLALQVDPTGQYLYVVHEDTPGSQYTTYIIKRYLIDATTGKLSQPVTEASYKLDSVVSAVDCSLSITGMNLVGTELYDAVICSYPHGGISATYYKRTVNTQTGALGPDQQVYSFNNNSGETNYQVQFMKNLMFVLVSPNVYPPDNTVDVYSLSNTKNPQISCTSSMVANCASDFYEVVHPSAQYLFLINPQTYATDIDKVKLNSKQMVATSSTIPYEVEQFSPDGKIAYAANDVNGAVDIEIYGFNTSNAQVTTGGLIYVPSGLDPWFAAERR